MPDTSTFQAGIAAPVIHAMDALLSAPVDWSYRRHICVPCGTAGANVVQMGPYWGAHFNDTSDGSKARVGPFDTHAEAVAQVDAYITRAAAHYGISLAVEARDEYRARLIENPNL